MRESLIIRDDGECTLWVALVTAPTRKALGKKVSELNWRHPLGTHSAQLLRAYKIHRGEWCGVVVMGAYRHV